jgi:hypothetical protein
MVANEEIVTLSATHRPGTFGWRHVLAWRQLSILWQIPVLHYLADKCFSKPKAAAVYSVAIRHGECGGDFAEQCCRIGSSVVTFLDRTSMRLSGTPNSLMTEFQGHYVAKNCFRHVFRLEQRHPLVAGLPTTVSIYGKCPIVTPLCIENGMQVLVSLDGVPIIAFHQRHLLVGADPWQFGVPSVPMLYKVLSNWLIQEVGNKHRMLEPCAAIRLDDLPSTAENLKAHPPGRKLDRKRSRIIRRLRRFGKRTATPFTFMYSSHFREANGTLTPISSVMPRSISEMQLGVKQGVFEIGSHGMVHLRSVSSDSTSTDPREFMDLDVPETVKHLDACESEILQLFDKKPQSFVAPAWGYRSGLTKQIAAERYPIIIDSSQHVEIGLCDVLWDAVQQGGSLNMVETFRSGDRMLTYSNADFWKCYAAGGIPIHYMQHVDTNWHILRNFLKSQAGSKSEASQTHVQSKLLHVVENPKRPRYLRVLCAAAFFFVNCWLEPASWRLLWRSLTRSSLYAFVRAMKSAGYRLVTLTELGTIEVSYTNSRHKDQVDLAAGNY